MRTVQRLFSGTRLRLSAGQRLPTPTTVLAHGRTPNQHHNHDSSSCPNTRHECGDRVPLVLTRVTAPIRNHTVARTGHWCQGRNDRTSQSARGDNCKLAHTARHRLSFQSLRAKIARIFFGTTANHVELSFTQCLMMPQVTRLQMPHPTATNSVDHSTRSI